MIPIDLLTLPTVGPSYGTVIPEAGGVLIDAAARTDAFTPPDGGAAVDRLPGLRLACPSAPWSVAVRVQPDFRAPFDAGAMMLRTASRAWAKLAFERSPDGRRMAVSVVTRGVSDDANGPVFSADHLHLRACFTGTAHAFHISTEGDRWDLLRFFALPDPVVFVDFIAQSPVGEGCRVRFDTAWMADRVPADLRDGT